MAHRQQRCHLRHQRRHGKILRRQVVPGHRRSGHQVQRQQRHGAAGPAREVPRAHGHDRERRQQRQVARFQHQPQRAQFLHRRQGRGHCRQHTPQRPRRQAAAIHARRAAQHHANHRHLQGKQPCDEHNYVRLKHLHSRPRRPAVHRMAPLLPALYRPCVGPLLSMPHTCFRTPGAASRQTQTGRGARRGRERRSCCGDQVSPEGNRQTGRSQKHAGRTGAVCGLSQRANPSQAKAPPPEGGAGRQG
ncbi:hypothetical protein D9M72_318340 [compost metagenome]